MTLAEQPKLARQSNRCVRLFRDGGRLREGATKVDGRDVFGLARVPHGHGVAGERGAGPRVLGYDDVVGQRLEQGDQVVRARRPPAERDEDRLDGLLSGLPTVETQRLEQHSGVLRTGMGDGQVAARVT